MQDEEVLFYLPVTKAWLRQVVLGLVLLCHSSFRGVMAFFRDLLDCPLSLGSVHHIVRQAVSVAQQVNAAQDLCGVRAGSHDELFQAGQPVLAGIDLDSTYCYLLAAVAHRDAETWGIHLLDLAAQGLRPDYTVADAQARLAGRPSAGLARGALPRGGVSRPAGAHPPERHLGTACLCGHRPARCAGTAEGPSQAPPPGPCPVPATRPRPYPRGERPAPGRRGAHLDPLDATRHPRPGWSRRLYPPGPL
jgi:hypothetical protein